MVFGERVHPVGLSTVGYFEPQVVIMYKFLLLEALVQLLRNNLLHSQPILPIQDVEFTIAMSIHVVSTHVSTYLDILVQSFQFLSLRVSIVFQSYWIIGKSIFIGICTHWYWLFALDLIFGWQMILPTCSLSYFGIFMPVTICYFIFRGSTVFYVRVKTAFFASITLFFASSAVRNLFETFKGLFKNKTTVNVMGWSILCLQ